MTATEKIAFLIETFNKKGWKRVEDTHIAKRSITEEPLTEDEKACIIILGGRPAMPQVNSEHELYCRAMEDYIWLAFDDDSGSKDTMPLPRLDPDPEEFIEDERRHVYVYIPKDVRAVTLVFTDKDLPENM